MDTELRKALKDMLNTAKTPGDVVKRFRLDGEALLDESDAKVILGYRNKLPNDEFTDKDIERLSTFPSVAKKLPKILGALPALLKWRYNNRPVLLFPFRLETRFLGTDLWVRIYPDQVLIDTHESRLTKSEHMAGQRYFDAMEEAASDEHPEDARKAAWRELAQLFGPERAAWIKTTVKKVNPGSLKSDDEDWLVVPKLTALPDRFEVFAYRGDQLVHRVQGKPIRRDLTMFAAPAMSRGEFLDSRSQWMSDHEQAYEDGMAIRIEGLSRKDLKLGFSRIVLVGVRTTSAERGQAVLQELLQSHRYSTGLGFLRYGTPTNNTRQTRSGHSESQEDIEGTDLDETAAGLSPDASHESNAGRLSHAFGLRIPERADVDEEELPGCVLFGLENAGVPADAYGRDMQLALWPATGCYLLGELMPGIVANEDLVRLYEYFVEYVRASGPLPGIRIGDQPYGVLPVSAVRAMKPFGNPRGWVPSRLDRGNADAGLPSTAFDKQLHAVLLRLHEQWLAWANNHERVPRMGTTEDPDRELLEILSMEPDSVSCRVRPFVDERFVAWLLVALRGHAFGPGTPFADLNPFPLYWASRWADEWRAYRSLQAQRWSILTDAPQDSLSDAPLLSLLAWWNDMDLQLPLIDVAKDGGNEDLASNYLKELGQPGGIVTSRPLTLLHDLLERSLVLVRNFSDEPRVRAAIKRLGDYHNAELQSDSEPPQPELARLLRQTLDLQSNRLDAWITALAWRRLESMRKSKSADSGTPMSEGIYYGAYGWVENAVPGDAADSAGYIHAPSSGQAAAAAVLHNAYLTHDYGADGGTDGGSPPNPFRINLSSERTRYALRLIDGVRTGQPLGALLGYQFERDLQEGRLDLHIDRFRRAFPLVANKESEVDENDGISVEAVAARNVVDGLSLVRWWENPDRTDVTLGDAEAVEVINSIRAGATGSYAAICKAVERLRSNLDAVTDALTYEGVYQAVQGNFERAGAALDAAAGNVYQQELESLQTPGAAQMISHRIFLMMRAADHPPPGPRGMAEPSVAAWFAKLLDPMSQFGSRFEFRSDRININTAPREVLATLQHVGDGAARKIDDRRKQNGPFKSLSELNDVPGFEQPVVDVLSRWCMTGYETEAKDALYERIDINTADEAELGKFLDMPAEVIDAIVDHRGSFTQIDDLKTKAGVDSQVVAAIRPFLTTGRDALTLADLSSSPVDGSADPERERFTPVDLLYLSDTPPQGGETELEQRIYYWVRREFGLKPDARVNLLPPTATGLRPIDDAIEFGRQVLITLGSGSPLLPASLCLPQRASDVTSAGDVGELGGRIGNVLTKMNEFITTLSGSPNHSDALEALFKASQFGVSGAIPPAPDEPDAEFDARVANVLRELRGRAARCHGLRDSESTEEAPEREIERLLKAMKALFGEGFVVLPTFEPHNRKQLETAFGQANLLQTVDEERVRLWLQQMAQVNPAVRELHDMIMISEAWKQHADDAEYEPPLKLQLAQLTDDDSRCYPWVGLDEDERALFQVDIVNSSQLDAEQLPEDLCRTFKDQGHPLSPYARVIVEKRETQWLVLDVRDQYRILKSDTALIVVPRDADHGTLSIATVVDAPLDWSKRVGGLLIEQWEEPIPSDTVDTSVSFQYDGPNTQAPQALLLAVPSQRTEVARQWEAEDLVEILNDTLDLCKVRAVDLDAMGDMGGAVSPSEGVGLVLPALMLPADPNHPWWDRKHAFAQGIYDWLEKFPK